MSIFKKKLTEEDIRWRNKLSSKYRKQNKQCKTLAEKTLEQPLRDLFRGKSRVACQKVFFTPDSFVLIDFWLVRFKVGIEVDGGYHFTLNQIKKDNDRQSALNKRRRCGKPVDFKIIRFTNEEVINDLDKVLRIIYEFAEKNG